jgi:hypothetical protein
MKGWKVVPDEGIEPPTFGLQNRCSTAELIRLGLRPATNRDEDAWVAKSALFSTGARKGERQVLANGTAAALNLVEKPLMIPLKIWCSCDRDAP